MGEQDGRVTLEHGADGGEGQVFADEVERQKTIAGNGEVDPAGEQELRLVHLRPALADRDVEAVLGVDAGGHGLVEPAILGLGQPIEAERDPIGGVCGER